MQSGTTLSELELPVVLAFFFFLTSLLFWSEITLVLSLYGKEAWKGLRDVLALQESNHLMSLSTCGTCTLAAAANIALCVLLPFSVSLSHASSKDQEPVFH